MSKNHFRDLAERIFSIQSENDFEKTALEIFRLQSAENSVYGNYVSKLNISPGKIKKIEEIPFIPVEFFKTEIIASGNRKTENIFTSSGTTGSVVSKHYVEDISLYEKSFSECFELFYGKTEEYCILALLPSYLERNDSSLVYMMNDLIKKSNHPKSGFYLHNLDELAGTLNELKSKRQKTILLGVTYALLDLAEKNLVHFPELTIIETGGMKGKRKEIIREELHEILCHGFDVKKIHSEYGMTELLSQAYSYGDGIFRTPPWMQILIRDTNDPLDILTMNATGGINVIDLANIYSCSFIATQDLGKIHDDKSFEVLGRFDLSDIRGCNLLAE